MCQIGVAGGTGEIVNRRFSKQELIEFVGERSEGRVALEACGSAHWWAGKIKALGHEVVLLHAKSIRPFVQNDKTDAADARAIWTAAQQPGMRRVAPKTEDQQAMLGLHRMRALLVKSRTMLINQLRGLMYEFGVIFKAGRRSGLADIRRGSTKSNKRSWGCCSMHCVSSFNTLGNSIARSANLKSGWQRVSAKK